MKKIFSGFSGGLLVTLNYLSGYFLGACHTTTPPIAITAIPTSGDHFRLCRLFAVMLISPIFATLSLEKKVTVVKMVKTKPIKRRAYPSFFMIDLF
jgi:hypothetical protein